MNKLNIVFTGKAKPVKPINEQFTLCKCYVMALGKNQNKTNIPKEAVEDALPSLFNIPVVAHLYSEKDDEVFVGGHDMELTVNENGEYVFRVLTVPYGTVPQQDNLYYEEVEEEDGTVNTYLVADIILWTGRYPELLNATYSDEIYFAQSMEIIPKKTTEKEGYLNIEKFQFSALCLLGKSGDEEKNVEPCFASARVEPYSFAAEKEELTKLFEEFKHELAKCFEAQSFGEGGNKLDKELIANILAEYGFAEEDLPFEITEEMTEEEFRKKLDELKAAKSAEEEADTNSETDIVKAQADTTEDKSSDTKEQAYAKGKTWTEKTDMIREALDKYAVISDDYFEEYRLIDFDDEYAYVSHDKWGENQDHIRETLRISYSITDDVAAVDVTNAVAVRLVWLTKEEEDAISAKDKEYAALIEYKNEKIKEERMREYGAAAAEFSELAELDEYKEVIKNMETYASKDDLLKELYAIRGKNIKPSVGKRPLSERKFSVGTKDEEKITKQQERAVFMEMYLSK